MADDTRDLMLTPMTRVQFQPLAGDLYMLVVDGEPVGDLRLNPEAAGWFATLPTASQHDETLQEMRAFFESQGVTLEQ